MILMVDDEPKYVEPYLEELKMRFGDDSVWFFNTVDAGWKQLESDPTGVDLLILDIMMAPGKTFEGEQTNHGLRTGVKMYEAIRRRMPELPVIILTNVTDENVAKGFTDTGVVWLAKSETFPDELSDKVDELLLQRSDRGVEVRS